MQRQMRMVKLQKRQVEETDREAGQLTEEQWRSIRDLPNIAGGSALLQLLEMKWEDAIHRTVGGNPNDQGMTGQHQGLARAYTQVIAWMTQEEETEDG